MILEFFGLPGVGKSYLGMQIERELNSNGERCISIVERSRTSFHWKLWYKLAHLFVSVTPTYKEKVNSLISITKEYEARLPIYNVPAVRIVNYIKQIAFLDYIYSKLALKSTLYIFDEGIIQQIANMIVNYQLDKDTLGKMLAKLENGFTVVYMSWSIEKILDSIKQRNRHVCYIDELTGAKLEDFLSCYLNACELLSYVTKPIKINRESDISEYASVIIKETTGDAR